MRLEDSGRALPAGSHLLRLHQKPHELVSKTEVNQGQARAVELCTGSATPDTRRDWHVVGNAECLLLFQGLPKPISMMPSGLKALSTHFTRLHRTGIICSKLLDERPQVQFLREG